MPKTHSPFDSRDTASLGRFDEELHEIYGEVLQTVIVTGEAASESYRPGLTPLQTVVILSELTAAALRAARPSLKRWARWRIPTPLFFDPAYIEGALDTFPLEFQEIVDHHVVLSGDAAAIEGIEVDRSHLRLEVEEQLRGKLLHLWEAYLSAGGRRRNLERLLLESLPGFELAMRGLLILGSGERGEGTIERPVGVALIEAAAERLGVPLPTMVRLEGFRLAGARVEDNDLDLVFEHYLDEVRAIVASIDGL